MSCLPSSAILHLARFGLLFIFTFVLATSLFFSDFKLHSDSKFWYQPRNSSWPDSHFWQKLTRDPRSTNRCSYSGCPIHVAAQKPSVLSDPQELTPSCPFYFQWIHEDLAPWTQSGISRSMLESVKSLASFRVVIKSGRLYVDPYATGYQTRSVFTIWGLLQLLELYPGLVPDVDFLIGCEDRPRILRKHYKDQSPPPVFRYCTTAKHFDIPFPDWSFWGWPEVGLRPWDGELREILKKETEIPWEKRHPTAFWRGNTDTGGALRKELKYCNGTRYGAQIYHQNWKAQNQAHFKDSRLAQQCKHRYKIYVEGRGWSVSLKYILACDSPTLLVDSSFYDFFSRALVPKKHFWPVRRTKLCDSIKFGVNWGNNNTKEAESLGSSGRQFVMKELSMKHVYDYMLYSLREYAKLLRYEPTIGNLTELCSETFLCQATDREKPFYEESMVRTPSNVRPCSLPSRDEALVKALLQKGFTVRRHVEEEDSQTGSII